MGLQIRRNQFSMRVSLVSALSATAFFAVSCKQGNESETEGGRSQQQQQQQQQQGGIDENAFRCVPPVSSEGFYPTSYSKDVKSLGVLVGWTTVREMNNSSYVSFKSPHAYFGGLDHDRDCGNDARTPGGNLIPEINVEGQTAETGTAGRSYYQGGVYEGTRKVFERSFSVRKNNGQLEGVLAGGSGSPYFLGPIKTCGYKFYDKAIYEKGQPAKNVKVRVEDSQISADGTFTETSNCETTADGKQYCKTYDVKQFIYLLPTNACVIQYSTQNPNGKTGVADVPNNVKVSGGQGYIWVSSLSKGGKPVTPGKGTPVATATPWVSPTPSSGGVWQKGDSFCQKYPNDASCKTTTQQQQQDQTQQQQQNQTQQQQNLPGGK
jgi:hypothetical protein